MLHAQPRDRLSTGSFSGGPRPFGKPAAPDSALNRVLDQLKPREQMRPRSLEVPGAMRDRSQSRGAVDAAELIEGARGRVPASITSAVASLVQEAVRKPTPGAGTNPGTQTNIELRELAIVVAQVCEHVSSEWGLPGFPKERAAQVLQSLGEHILRDNISLPNRHVLFAMIQAQVGKLAAPSATLAALYQLTNTAAPTPTIVRTRAAGTESPLQLFECNPEYLTATNMLELVKTGVPSAQQFAREYATQMGVSAQGDGMGEARAFFDTALKTGFIDDAMLGGQHLHTLLLGEEGAVKNPAAAAQELANICVVVARLPNRNALPFELALPILSLCSGKVVADAAQVIGTDQRPGVGRKEKVDQLKPLAQIALGSPNAQYVIDAANGLQQVLGTIDPPLTGVPNLPFATGDIGRAQEFLHKLIAYDALPDAPAVPVTNADAVEEDYAGADGTVSTIGFHGHEYDTDSVAALPPPPAGSRTAPPAVAVVPVASSGPAPAAIGDNPYEVDFRLLTDEDRRELKGIADRIARLFIFVSHLADDHSTLTLKNVPPEDPSQPFAQVRGPYTPNVQNFLSLWDGKQGALTPGRADTEVDFPGITALDQRFQAIIAAAKARGAAAAVPFPPASLEDQNTQSVIHTHAENIFTFIGTFNSVVANREMKLSALYNHSLVIGEQIDMLARLYIGTGPAADPTTVSPPPAAAAAAPASGLSTDDQIRALMESIVTLSRVIGPEHAPLPPTALPDDALAAASHISRAISVVPGSALGLVRSVSMYFVERGLLPADADRTVAYARSHSATIDAEVRRREQETLARRAEVLEDELRTQADNVSTAPSTDSSMFDAPPAPGGNTSRRAALEAAVRRAGIHSIADSDVSSLAPSTTD